MKNPIQNAFEKQLPLIIPYLTMGDPDSETTYQSIRTLADAGADMIELGVPFTDPAADGPTIQKSAERALLNPFSLQHIFTLAKRLRQDGVTIPLVLMSYTNPIYVYGFDLFCKEAADSGIDGLLLTDMPPEESADYLKAAQAAKLDTVFLCSPTTSPERLSLVDQSSSAYVYYVARAGVTGVRPDLPEDIQDKLTMIRQSIGNRLCVGFGISTPAQATVLAPYVDGIIIGSALVNLFERYQGQVLQEQIHLFMSGIVKAVRHV
jgi:tryptophan synthase alpha chain